MSWLIRIKKYQLAITLLSRNLVWPRKARRGQVKLSRSWRPSCVTVQQRKGLRGRRGSSKIMSTAPDRPTCFRCESSQLSVGRPLPLRCPLWEIIRVDRNLGQLNRVAT